MLIISGAQGVGKTTLINLLLKVRPLLRLSISSTTRKKRIGEKDDENREYNFLNEEDFYEKEKSGHFMEIVQVHGFKYGTEKIYFTDYSILNVTASSIENFKSLIDKKQHYISIFIDAPIETIRERIHLRQDLDLDKKLEFSIKEIEYKKHFDYIVSNNGSIEKTLEEILIIVDQYLEKINNINK